MPWVTISLRESSRGTFGRLFASLRLGTRQKRVLVSERMDLLLGLVVSACSTGFFLLPLTPRLFWVVNLDATKPAERITAIAVRTGQSSVEPVTQQERERYESVKNGATPCFVHLIDEKRTDRMTAAHVLHSRVSPITFLYPIPPFS